jgi:hypothetical protein
MIKRVFISSTVYDLKTERKFLKDFLESFRTKSGIRFKCFASDFNDFPITPTDVASIHSYQMCLDKIADSDYFILLIKKRYGDPIIEYDGSRVSITEREYHEAYQRAMPIFTFVDQRTWNAKNAFKSGRAQTFIKPKQVRVLDFIDTVRMKPRSNWITFYKSKEDLRLRLKSALFTFDDSQFIADVTIPDGTIVLTGQTFEKIWEFKNNGTVAWEGRYLREEASGGPGLVPDDALIPIPKTMPGEHVRITVRFTAPQDPSTIISYWKMVDSAGQYCFPEKRGLWCKVIVRRSTLGFPSSP